MNSSFHSFVLLLSFLSLSLTGRMDVQSVGGAQPVEDEQSRRFVATMAKNFYDFLHVYVFYFVLQTFTSHRRHYFARG